MSTEVRSRSRAATRPLRGLLAGFALLFVIGCGSAAVPTCGSGAGAGTCTRILFLGNSFTYVNDLPSTFAQLAWSAGHAVEVAMVANGGETLAQHAASSDSLGKIAAGGWTYVVLQEQSDTPATTAASDYYMYPAARTLADRAEHAGAVPMFFMTWAHKDGEPTAGQNYEAMQQAVDNSYLGIARELRVPVAPVGYAWYLVRHDRPEIALWGDDGIHPSKAGTYLAACVFYASVFRQSPNGLSFHGGVSDEQARVLQDEAGRRVLDMQAEWGLR
jgi:hypothetical protein